MKVRTAYLLFSLFAFFFFACNSGSENTQSSATVGDTLVTAEEAPDGQEEAEEKVILFFGNSLTAGYGLDPSLAFPNLIQQKLDSLGYNYRVVNAGLSGETSAGGRERIDWVLERQPVEVFVLELGANDGLRGLDLSETRKNLAEIIDRVRAKNPEAEIVLAGMMVPPNLGQEYGAQFNEIYPSLAKEKDVALIPFLLQDVAGEPSLNLDDRIHPNEAGQKLVARNVWQVLQPVLEEQRQQL